MPLYLYKAKNKQGENKVGHLEANDEHELALKLREQDLILISGETLEQQSQTKKFDIRKIISRIGWIPLAEKMMFSRNLSIMIKSGVPLNQALSSMAEQTNNPKFRKTIKEIEARINKGEAFSGCLKRYPKIFNEVYVSMIRVGETSGTLEEVLKTLAKQMEKDHQLINRVRGALIYPIVIIVTMILIVIFMMITVVPKLTQVFTELEIELPITTRVVISISNFFKNNYITGIIFAILLIIFLKFILKIKEVKRAVHKSILRLPIFGAMVKKVNSARFARNFSALFESGVPIIESLQIVAGTLGNVLFKQALMEGANQVQKGEDLSKILGKYDHLFPPMTIQMLHLGEETGNLNEILENMANFYEEEIDSLTKNLSSIIEPLIMVLIAIVVGFFAISMIQPMYSIMGGI